MKQERNRAVRWSAWLGVRSNVQMLTLAMLAVGQLASGVMWVIMAMRVTSSSKARTEFQARQSSSQPESPSQSFGRVQVSESTTQYEPESLSVVLSENPLTAGRHESGLQFAESVTSAPLRFHSAVLVAGQDQKALADNRAVLDRVPYARTPNRYSASKKPCLSAALFRGGVQDRPGSWGGSNHRPAFLAMAKAAFAGHPGGFGRTRLPSSGLRRARGWARGVPSGLPARRGRPLGRAHGQLRFRGWALCRANGHPCFQGLALRRPNGRPSLRGRPIGRANAQPHSRGRPLALFFALFRIQGWSKIAIFGN